MAKSKKQEPAAAKADAPAPKKTPAKKEAPAAASAKAEAPAPAKKAAPPKKAGKADKAPASGGGAPLLIDTGLAAQTAAAMVANKVAQASSSGQPQKPQESAGFKNLKESLNKPAAGGLGGILGTGSGSQKFPAFGAKHGNTGPGTGGGRNQTFGADVNRASVPRRTGGG